MAKGLHFHRTKGHQIAIPLDLPGTATLGLSSAHQSCRYGMSRSTPDLAAGAPAEGKKHMVQYIKSDLDFILDADQDRRGTCGRPAAVRTGRPHPHLQSRPGACARSMARYNHLLPGQEQWGAAGGQFPHLVDPNYRPADGTLFDPDGPWTGAGNADLAQLQSVEQSQLARLRLRACARSPTCWSIRRWEIPPQS